MARLVLAGFMAWALLLEAYVTESHIHNDEIVAASSVAATGAPGHHNLPAKDDAAKCPICQQIGRAGQFVAPSWLLPFLLVLSISVVEIASLERPRFNPVSHSWRGRGPPLR